ncbi:MAG: 4-guanidinobutyraldehyde dehydrogenase / NAD-dependent aldehyde dehydrogenase [Gaiellales bacterium]|nr:4-guanidinobutyraldehyde dehydrogenase / NAD-dependent aldehyde dehydrogenase [Gaiellales bacterium]
MSTTADPTTWAAQAEQLSVSGQAFINNQSVDARSGKTFDKHSPVDGRHLAAAAEGDKEDIDDAVRAARAAFEGGAWPKLAPRERKNLLLGYAQRILAAKDELAVLSTLEMGKPIADSLGEVDAVAQCIAYYAEAIDKTYGEIGPTPQSSLTLITREPAGVVGAVTPWNYPLLMPAWKIGPALATGNTMVLKPAEQTPLSAIRLGELAAEAGIPAGVLNVVPGFGETAGAAVGLHMDVDVISFTGSGEVGKFFLRYAGESNMKAVWLECGGKSPNVVLADAPDIARAAEAIAEGVFVNAGQMCNAGTRLVVEESVREDLLGRLVDAAKPWMPIHPFQDGARMGAMVDENQMNRVLGYIDAGRSDGATLVTGGNRALTETGGYYIEPTIFTDAKNDMRIAQEEIFGPVLTVIGVDNPEEAVKVANDTSYGLAAAVWSRDITRAHRIARALRAGNVYINTYDRGDISVPFATFKQSGIGVDKSLHAMDKYTRLKTTWVDLS